MARRVARKAVRKEVERKGRSHICPEKHKGKSSILQAMRKEMTDLISCTLFLAPLQGIAQVVRRSSVFHYSTTAPQFCAISALRILLEPLDLAGQISGVLAGCVIG